MPGVHRASGLIPAELILGGYRGLPDCVLLSKGRGCVALPPAGFPGARLHASEGKRPPPPFPEHVVTDPP